MNVARSRRYLTRYFGIACVTLFSLFMIGCTADRDLALLPVIGEACTGTETCYGPNVVCVDDGSGRGIGLCGCSPGFAGPECLMVDSVNDAGNGATRGGTGGQDGAPGMAIGDAGGVSGARDSCAQARRQRSHIGCEFWPVDLDNALEVDSQTPTDDGRCRNEQYQNRSDLAVCTNGSTLAGLCEADQVCPPGFQCEVGPACVLDAQRSPFSIVVSNPSDTEAATVTLTDAQGQLHSQVLYPNDVQKIFPYSLGFRDASIDKTSQTRRAFRLQSSAPVVAYQFNPLDNMNPFSSDGSLLIPEHALGTTY